MVVLVFMKNKEKIRQIWKGKRVAKHANYSEDTRDKCIVG